MQCEVCYSREATIHLTEITEGVRTETHLCEQCAQEQGVGVKNYIPLNELLSNLLSVGPKGGDSSRGESTEPACPHCGWTLEKFREKAVLGCPYDYEVFEKELQPLIKKAHEGATAHRGKIPSRMPKDTKRQIEIAQIRRQLDDAVRSEDYEQAARLRDKLAGSK
ncbi:MAG: UvrB/UvrC motif-containing protein [Sedimentisphaerales bacterium]|nr:UvrB/UvrC motif-containing protein [Sedimentisphaerales bacterium]